MTVTVDGRRYVVDVTVVDGVWSLILGSSPDDRSRRSHEVAIVASHPRSGSLVIHVDGCPVSAAVADGRTLSTGRAADVKGAAAAPHQVRAPMPGKVVRVLVRPGEAVAPRQGVIVVEAMKMENELRTPRAGRVAEVKVSEGASVEAGAILAIIE